MKDKLCEAPVLIGHHFASHGMGEHIRCTFRAFRSAGLTLSLNDIYSLGSQIDPDFAKEFGNHLVKHLSSFTNIFHINGAGVEEALRYIGNNYPLSAYNIIYPTWELSIYPEEWAQQLEHFNEIWVPSQFVFDSITKVVSKQVFHMPLSVEVRLSSFLGRRYFELPESSYLFLFCFDFNSYIDRKNPFAVIKAFEKACSARPGIDTRLVIKLNRDINSSEGTKSLPRIIEAVDHCQYRDKVIIIDKVFSDNEIKNLIRCCDCFISLHRSEGFGRGMVEAMILGKPVIATAYSGNLDFMNETNSCLVRYNLINVEEGQYPYAKGQVWADADIDHAVYYMLKLLDDRDYGRRLGDIASSHIKTYFNYRAIGLRYRERLDRILHMKSSCPEIISKS
jgi:glycosyltransferase involved in cell wall biosynthesis